MYSCNKTKEVSRYAGGRALIEMKFFISVISLKHCNILVRISYIPRRHIFAFKEGLPAPDDDDDIKGMPPTPRTPNRAGAFAAIKSRFETTCKCFLYQAEDDEETSFIVLS